MARAKEEGNLPLEGHHAVADFVHALSKPRKIVILVQAGAAVDSTIEQLSAVCEVRRKDRIHSVMICHCQDVSKVLRTT